MTGLQKLCALVTNRSGKRRKRKQTNQYVLYFRVSTRRQGESGLGLEAQKSAAEAFVKQQGGTVIAEYQEIETGKNCERPELLKAVLHANRCWGATLVIAKLDRLARNVWFCSTLMESGISFVACDNPFATRLSLHILSAVGEEEARLISQRTKDALTAYRMRGGVLGPATFRNQQEWRPKQEQSRRLATQRNTEIAAAAYEEVRPIILSLRQQGHSFQAIANELNRLDHRTRTGKPWSKSQVKRVADRVIVQSSDNTASAFCQ